MIFSAFSWNVWKFTQFRGRVTILEDTSFDYFGTVSILQMKIVIYRKKRCEDFELIFLFQTNAANDIDLLMLLIGNSEQLVVLAA